MCQRSNPLSMRCLELIGTSALCLKEQLMLQGDLGVGESDLDTSLLAKPEDFCSLMSCSLFQTLLEKEA